MSTMVKSLRKIILKKRFFYVTYITDSNCFIYYLIIVPPFVEMISHAISPLPYYHNRDNREEQTNATKPKLAFTLK
jgi:hypothetical protein